MAKVILGKQVESKEDFNVDVDLLVEGGLLLTASSGNGKSHQLKKLMQMTYGRCGHILIDVEGDFNGMRTDKYDYILAGRDENADIKITHKGEFPSLLARKVLELNANIIIDLYELEPDEQKEFTAKFVRALVDIPKNLWGKKYLIIIDEAHELCSEEKRKNENTAAKDAIIALAAKGRKRGLRLVAATQRLAKLAKNASSELKNQLIGGLNNSDDRKRACEEIGMDKADADVFRTLDIGNFFAVGTAFGFKNACLVRAGDLENQKAVMSKDVNRYIAPPTEKVRNVLSKLADLPQEAEKELKTKQDLEAEVMRLKTELRKKDLAGSMQQQPVKIVQNAPSAEQVQEIRNKGYQEGWNECCNEWNKVTAAVPKDLIKIANKIDDLVTIKNMVASLQQSFTEKLPSPAPLLSKKPALYGKTPVESKLALAQIRQESSPKAITVSTTVATDNNGQFNKMERAILKFLALRSSGTFTQSQIAVMNNYAVSGGFKNSLSKLNVNGLIIKEGPDSIRLNPDRLSEVVSILGDEYQQQDRNSLEAWMQGKLPKMANEIYRHLYNNQDREFTVEELASELGYAVSGGFKNSISQLNVLTLLKKTPDRKKVQFNTDLLSL